MTVENNLADGEDQELVLIEPYKGGREWTSLLNPPDIKNLKKIENEIFGKYLKDGYEIVWAMGVESGRLLREGPMVEQVQSEAARDQISELRHKDYILLDNETMKRSEKKDFKWPWWGNSFRRAHLPEYIWAEKAIVPPENWEKRKKLSIKDIKVDKLGITIFVKKDSFAKKSKIFK